MSDGMLTAEQVRDAWCGNLKRDCLYDPPTPDWQAIADELNAMLGNGTCECENCAPPLDVLLRCLENDYGIRASWDGLRRVWLTESVTAELDYIEDNSRWFELFGTPEMAARTLYESTSECRCCVIRDQCGYDLDKCVMYDRDKLLEWLRGDAE